MVKAQVQHTAPQFRDGLEGLEDFNISGLVAIAAGGLSGYEDYRVLLNKAQTGQPPFHSGGDRDRAVTTASYMGVLNHYRYSRDDSPEPWGGYYPTDPKDRHSANTYRWIDSLLLGIFRRG